MAVLALRDGELELFEQTLLGPDAVRYFWSNAVADHGVFFTLGELEILLGRIGATSNWDFIRVRTEQDGGLWAQSCGQAAKGLVVEINGPNLVARSDARRLPRVNVGTRTWPYYASVDELYDVETAAGLLLAWIVEGEVPEGHDLREPDALVPRRD